MPDHGLIALSDVAKKLKLTRQGVYLRITRHKIPYEKIGGVAVMLKKDLHLIYKTPGKGRPRKGEKGKKLARV